VFRRHALFAEREGHEPSFRFSISVQHPDTAQLIALRGAICEATRANKPHLWHIYPGEIKNEAGTNGGSFVYHINVKGEKEMLAFEKFLREKGIRNAQGVG
jgi:hypothetical protein